MSSLRKTIDLNWKIIDKYSLVAEVLVNEAEELISYNTSLQDKKLITSLTQCGKYYNNKAKNLLKINRDIIDLNKEKQNVANS